MRKILLLGALAPLLFAQISAFDAGNVELENPYGLTDSEKTALKNKKHLEGLSKEYAGVDFKTTKALERIDGMQSLLDDLGLKQQNFATRLSDFEAAEQSAIQAQNAEIAKLKNLIYANSAEIAKLKKAITELADALEAPAAARSAASAQQGASQTAALNPAARAKEAERLFNAGDYARAAAEYEALIALRHRPAANNFKLAECAFFMKDYERAIFHYKASNDSYRSQNAKNPFEPASLLHTARSLEGLGKGIQAKAFYDALRSKYPQSAEAKSIK